MFTGMKIVMDGELVSGGGTSMAAPLWAGMSAVMNQFLLANGGRRLGDLNPILYRIAQGARLPTFHDIVSGANAVAKSEPGYDQVTGLGSPNVDNLVRDVLDLQRILN
jgi:kumamolisin